MESIPRYRLNYPFIYHMITYLILELLQGLHYINRVSEHRWKVNRLRGQIYETNVYNPIE